MSTPSELAAPSAAERYQALETKRHPFLNRARLCAELTLPYLFPPEGHNQQAFQHPFQSIGARGVRNLASKFLLALLPPNEPFFRYRVNKWRMAIDQVPQELIAEIETALSTVERAVVDEAEGMQLRPAAFNAFLAGIVGGNFCLHVPKKGPSKGYPLEQYVVERDPEGSLLTLIIKEVVNPSTLAPEIQELIKSQETTGSEESAQPTTDKTETVDLYTVVDRQPNGSWSVHQEIEGIKLPGSGKYKESELPYIVIRFHRLDGEDYGRGMVEEFYGDLWVHNKLSQAIEEAATLSSKVKFGVNKASGVNLKELTKIPNGGFFSASEGDVWALQVNKHADLQTALQHLQRIETRLEAAFLMTTSVQRQAERVTATEIRALIQELEDTLGGVYSVLGQEFQAPLVSAIEARMRKAQKLPKIPKDAVSVTVVTGMDALGRGHDLQKLLQYADILKNTVGPEQFAQSHHMTEFARRVADALGIDPVGLAKTAEEIQQEQQQAQAMAMASELGPEAIKQIGGAVQQVGPQQQPQP